MTWSGWLLAEGPFEADAQGNLLSKRVFENSGSIMAIVRSLSLAHRPTMAENSLPEPPLSASLPPRPQTNGALGGDAIEKPAEGLPPTPNQPAPAQDTRGGDRGPRREGRDDRPPSFNINNPQGRKIFIAQLPEDTTEEDLNLCFGSVGTVTSVELKRGFGFVVSPCSDLPHPSIGHFRPLWTVSWTLALPSVMLSVLRLGC
jgi:hypothetical protein